jgi:hypothetical protein
MENAKIEQIKSLAGTYDTARDFANDELFRALCKELGVRVTKRQAAKFRRGTGIAYKRIS